MNPTDITISPSQFGKRTRIFICSNYVCKKFAMKLRESVEQAWQNREMLTYSGVLSDIRQVIEEVDKGRLRVAEPTEQGWQVNEWVKQAILLYFSIQPMQTWNVEPFEFYDKMLLKK